MLLRQSQTSTALQPFICIKPTKGLPSHLEPSLVILDPRQRTERLRIRLQPVQLPWWPSENSTFAAANVASGVVEQLSNYG